MTVDLENNLTLKLALIPACKFMMGSPDSEQRDVARAALAAGMKDDVANRWYLNEGPQHEVTISRPFYMGLYTVTQEQYEQVMGKNPSQLKGPLNPVEMVSWKDAVEFCKKLSEKAGRKVRLPTEAEWEYACRAGAKTRFYFGEADIELGGHAWYAGNSDNKVHPVGQKKPNAFGLYDMHGNVWQWCADWYDEKYYATSPKVDPAGSPGPTDVNSRVLRGGCLTSSPKACRCSYRSGSEPSYRDNGIGFRVVLSAGPD